MKKTLIRICSIAAIGLALSACNNDAANKTAIDADNSAIDQLVQDKIKTLDDSLAKVCDDQVTTAATAKLEEESAHKAGSHPAHHTPAPAPVKKEEPKPSTVGNGKPNMNGGKTPGTVGNGKPSMNGTTGTTGVGNGKPKM